MNKIRYVHDEIAHNLKDPEIIVPILIEILKPKSVVDVGCGIGTFLHVFEKYGVNSVLGLDGDWVNKDLLSKHINIENFIAIDLEKGFSLQEKFDLAVCLEVMEHINEIHAHNAVKCITQLSDVIVFSSAIPGQMGQNHINEQWPNYWVEVFAKYDFTVHDILRPILWNHPDLSRWYKQNIFLVTKNGKNININIDKKKTSNNILPLVHPEYFQIRVKELEELLIRNDIQERKYNSLKNGNESILTYIKLLSKFILNKLNIKI